MVQYFSSKSKCLCMLKSWSYNTLISGHPGGLTPGTYWEIAWDLLTFVANFWPRMGHWTTFALPRQDTRGKTQHAIRDSRTPEPKIDWTLRNNTEGVGI